MTTATAEASSSSTPSSTSPLSNFEFEFASAGGSSSAPADSTASGAASAHRALPPRLPAELPSVHSVRERGLAFYAGPTDESNWVIPGRLLVGAYPSSNHDELNEAILTSILRLGVTTFVCLQQEYQHNGVTEELWRSGRALRPYIFDALAIASRAAILHQNDPANGGMPKPHEIKFLHCPIVDCACTTDEDVQQLAEDLCERLLFTDQVLYIHCWGGHGRTGTIVGVMLGMLYALNDKSALMRTQLYHDLRTCTLRVPSPQTGPQRKQVCRVLGTHRKTANGAIPMVRRKRRAVDSPWFCKFEISLGVLATDPNEPGSPASNLLSLNIKDEDVPAEKENEEEPPTNPPGRTESDIASETIGEPSPSRSRAGTVAMIRQLRIDTTRSPKRKAVDSPLPLTPMAPNANVTLPGGGDGSGNNNEKPGTAPSTVVPISRNRRRKYKVAKETSSNTGSADSISARIPKPPKEQKQTRKQNPAELPSSFSYGAPEAARSGNPHRKYKVAEESTAQIIPAHIPKPPRSLKPPSTLASKSANNKADEVRQASSAT